VMLKGIHAGASPQSRRLSSTDWKAEPRLEGKCGDPRSHCCHAGLVSIRFPPHWPHRSLRPVSGMKIVSGKASTFTSTSYPQAWQLAINRTNAILVHLRGPF
jgi:hypothetical protein